MQVSVRLAQPSDAAVLAGHRYAFRAEMEPAPEAREAFLARCTSWMASRLQQGSPWTAWLAEGPAGPVGSLWLQLIEKVPNPAPELESHGYVTSVYVEPAGRGGGAGKVLLDACLAHCRAAGVDSVVLWPSERSRTLYARAGFEPPTDIMELVLDPGRTLGRPRP